MRKEERCPTRSCIRCKKSCSKKKSRKLSSVVSAITADDRNTYTQEFNAPWVYVSPVYGWFSSTEKEKELQFANQLYSDVKKLITNTHYPSPSKKRLANDVIRKLFTKSSNVYWCGIGKILLQFQLMGQYIHATYFLTIAITGNVPIVLIHCHKIQSQSLSKTNYLLDKQSSIANAMTVFFLIFVADALLIHIFPQVIIQHMIK